MCSEWRDTLPSTATVPTRWIAAPALEKARSDGSLGSAGLLKGFDTPPPMEDCATRPERCRPLAAAGDRLAWLG